MDSEEGILFYKSEVYQNVFNYHMFRGPAFQYVGFLARLPRGRLGGSSGLSGELQR